MTVATLNMLAADKLNDNNYPSWKNTINTMLITDDLKFVLVEVCPQVPAANATRIVREAHEHWVKANEKARAYILASLSEVLAKKHESVLTAPLVQEHVLSMMVHFNVAEMNGTVIDEAYQANVATSTRKFHRSSTSRTKFVSSSSGTKKWKKKMGGQGNKVNPVTAKPRLQREYVSIATKEGH
ncbi:gag/pol protein [Cucumis melo var. makuwa]|uniref:Gag/pol protein n=1 Tax=Cucumis melo var. makuwa TaxID=1194695 RepID=A0A5D3CAB0_CUCMM|nr:gag/pol protein [Cucumis melo var. makuwa]